ncbi:hypothetical protein [Actinoplanes sp. NPDC049316]|uniref:hypothetical protein n=1 Tax=Actinoplanes sp. NPDC049316 TaxID=3154727 RepID=UPI003436B3FE
MLTFTMTDVPGPLGELRRELKRLHDGAGRPSSRKIKVQTGNRISHTTIAAVLSGAMTRWDSLEPVVVALGGDVAHVKRLWLRAVDDHEHEHEHKQESEPPLVINRITPMELGANCVLPHAADDQWVPRAMLRQMADDGRALTELAALRGPLLRQEFVRALLTARRVVVNRSYLIRNPVFAEAFSTDPAERGALAVLLRDRAIVPFLLTESSPVEGEFAEEPAARQAAHVWNEILREVTVTCVRFSWTDENSNALAVEDLEESFGTAIRRATGLNLRRLLADAEVRAEDERAFGEQVKLLPKAHTAEGDEVPLTRSELYRRHIVRPRTKVRDGVYDFDKPYMVALKWLFDLIYNSNLAVRLGVALTKPVDSAHRSLVHHPNFFQTGEDPEAFDSARVRAAVMEAVHDALSDWPALGDLSLARVVAVRASRPWRRYTMAVDTLLDEPWLLSHPRYGLGEVRRRHGDMLAAITEGDA